ncbi:MAG TPA: aminopeptidase [Caldilineaceae bacterium]|nr:aminopeptidase [Caldilineaceae bacterium]
MNDLSAQQRRYAELLIESGLNLQPGQPLRITAELEHRELVRLAAEVAYRRGARLVHVDWQDTPLAKARLLYSAPEYLGYFPDYEVTRHRQMVDERWARLALVGPEFPDLLDDVDPAAMRTVAQARAQALKFYMEASMANQLQWCVAGAPTQAWAAKVFPDLPSQEALTQLWRIVLQTCRVDQLDPAAAWRAHDELLKGVVAFMARKQVQSVRFFDPAPGPDGKPRTDLTVGLTDRPQWLGASAERPDGVRFFPNMPTEEVFSTPHHARTTGYARSSKPAFPFQREVRDAYFRFEQGELVEFSAAAGQEVLEQFFAINGTRRLGEVALVDVRSPVNQANVVFYETLFDENAACHIAFGKAYPDGVVDGSSLDEAELRALGVNEADAHLDVMIGTPTIQVIGRCADGSEALIIAQGSFVPEVTGEVHA